MEDNAMELCAAALSPSRFIAVDPSFKVLRSGKNKARQSWDLRALQRRREVREQPSLVGSGGPGSPGHRGARDTTNRRACSGSPVRVTGWSVSPHTSRLAELTSTCPETHAGGVDGWWFVDRKQFFIGIPVALQVKPGVISYVLLNHPQFASTYLPHVVYLPSNIRC